MSESSQALPGNAGEDALRKRWLYVVYMRDKWRAVPHAPLFPRMVATKDAGIAWLALVEQWEREGFRGERPEDFETYVAKYQAAETAFEAEGRK